ncbi:MAG: HAD hydrolase-like protein [Clostridia bacterium]|nr:HAD hydrolase-like protein [Clostridia bacterium]
MVKAIIFDKDGTLIDFDSFWIAVSVNAINHILRYFGREDIPLSEILSAIGVGNGVSDIDGLLCKGTYEQIALAINDVLKKYGCHVSDDEIIRVAVEAYNRNADSGVVKATCENIKEVLSGLKEKGIKLAVVTTDNPEITHKCLEELGTLALFDKVYTDDEKTPVKPDPYCAFDFSEFTGAEKHEMVMVGDTMTDVHFARNAGIAVIGVGKTEEKRNRLCEHADAVMPDISHIFAYIGEEK